MAQETIDDKSKGKEVLVSYIETRTTISSQFIVDLKLPYSQKDNDFVLQKKHNTQFTTAQLTRPPSNQCQTIQPPEERVTTRIHLPAHMLIFPVCFKLQATNGGWRDFMSAVKRYNYGDLLALQKCIWHGMLG